MTVVRFVPSDSAVRDEIITNVGENMCVEAGAGTGKTTVLVDRIVQILKANHTTVDHLAVITFTEKAAAELASRVRQGLERALVDPATNDEQRENIAAAMRGLNAAHIETIHAFAASLLRERPIEARLDPGFEVLADLPAQLSFESAWDDWITEQMAGDPVPQPLVDILNLGLKYELVRDAARRIHDHREALPLRPYADDAVDIDAFLVEMDVHLDALRALWPHIVDEANATFKSSHDMADAHQRFVALRDHPASLLRAIVLLDSPNTHSGSQNQWRRKGDGAAAKQALTNLKKLLEHTRETVRRQATARFVTWLQGFVVFYNDRRKREGTADFDDLLLWARELVRDRAEVRAYFADKFRCILVDEFQDTDPLQAEIVVRLCADGESVADWRSATLRPGSLFVVGDPKQSIYRFRRADITMYDDVTRNVFGGTPREITQNFRSVAPVIEWVNDVFGQLMQPQAGVQPRYIDLQARPDLLAERSDAITVMHGFGSIPPGKGAVTGVRRAEALALASLLSREVGGKQWYVRSAPSVGDDDAPGGTRAATWRDIAILIPNRTELSLYEEAFALADIPARHEGGRTFYKRQEVRELTAILRAIDDPSDGVAAIAALRSSAFGCSDEDLFLYKAAGGRFEHLAPPPTALAESDVATSLRTLADLAKERYEKPLPDLVRAALDRTRLIEFAMLQPQGEQIAANLLKVIDQARAFVDAQGGGLRGFVRWLKENTTRTADESEASVSEETDDVVRILTVYAAKGLEFPIVVFANMNADRRDYTDVIAEGASGAGPSLHIKLGEQKLGFRTPGFDEADASEHEHRKAEELRLLYVAATRARDRLVLPFFSIENVKPHTEPKTLNDWLRIAGADTLDAAAIDAAMLPPLSADPAIWRRDATARPDPSAFDDIMEAREEWKAVHQTIIDDAKTPRHIVTATSLKPEWEPPFSSSAFDDGVRRGRAAEFGSAVHSLLEHTDLSSGGTDDLAQRANAIAAEFGLDDRASEIERVASNALGSPCIARARRSPRVLREVPFAVPIPASAPGAQPTGIAEGRIDLLFEEDGALIIVDFKTDDIMPVDLDARTATYRNQALVYAWAAHRATNIPVREIIFLYARLPAEQIIAVDTAFMSEAEALMRSTTPVEA